tara:strand:- start:186 stop:635 length:450 start_codon:yes stop_codon:yes gene_type:complete
MVKKKSESFLDKINKSKLFAGLAMLMLNIGSKYIVIELSPNQESYFRNNIARQLLIFSIAWMGTRDILTSLYITAAFTILTQFLLNENSYFCILPKSLQKMKSVLDTNNDGVISKKEVDDAIKILNKAKNQKKTDDTLQLVDLNEKNYM